MTLQNRVTPFGEIVANPARGSMFGNRGGCFHDGERQELSRRRWASRQWICCVLEFKGRHIDRLMAPGHYTELFFLDEATAFAAGHRPCFECRRADAVRFRDAWFEGNRARLGLERPPSAPEMDRALHGERMAVIGAAALPRVDVTTLAEGAFVTLDGRPDEAWLLGDGKLRRWTFEGYTEARPADGEATLLTPQSVIGAFHAGYVPITHASARATG